MLLVLGMLLVASAHHPAPGPPDRLGPLRVEIVEDVWEGRVPRIEIRLRTVREYGCSNLRIDASVERHADTVIVRAHDLVPESLCDDGLGPATYEAPLDLRPGHYFVAVKADEPTDLFALDVTKSQLRLRPATRATVATLADTTVFRRAPINSFALYCGAGELEHGPEMCEDLGAWIEQQRGVSRFFFPPGGRLPYLLRTSTAHEERRYFTYGSPSVLSVIRECLRSVERQVRPAVGIVITLQTRNGELMRAWSTRAFHEAHIDPPRRVTAVAACPRRSPTRGMR